MYSNSYGVDNVRRGHLGYHGHDIDQSDALASQAGRHHLNCELETNVHCVGGKESSQEEHGDLEDPQIYQLELSISNQIFLSPTFSKSTEEHGEAAEEEGEGARPPPSQPVDPHDTEQVRRQLHGRGDHEGKVELKVEVGEVPHCRVVNTTHQHPEENAQHTQLPHLRCLEEIQIGVLGPALSHCEVNFYFDIDDRQFYLFMFCSSHIFSTL